MPTLLERSSNKSIKTEKNLKIDREDEETRLSHRKRITTVINNIKKGNVDNILDVPEVKGLVISLASEKDISKIKHNMQLIFQCVDLVLSAQNENISELKTEIQELKKSLEIKNSDKNIKDISQSVYGDGGNCVPKLSAEEVQALRNEVREMAYRGKPKDGILLYRGRRGGDTDAVSFFKKHYSQYIEPGQEVIFAPELGAIDPSLLASLRNECRSAANPMPLGTIGDRADARVERRFNDGKGAEHATRRAQARKRESVCSI